MQIGALQNKMMTPEVSGAPAGDKNAQLEKASRDFEAFVMGYIFDSASASNAEAEGGEEGDESLNSNGSDTYQSMLIQNLSQEGAKSPNGFGLARYLMHQIQARGGPVPTNGAGAGEKAGKNSEVPAKETPIQKSLIVSKGSGGSNESGHSERGVTNPLKPDSAKKMDEI